MWPGSGFHITNCLDEHFRPRNVTCMFPLRRLISNQIIIEGEDNIDYVNEKIDTHLKQKKSDVLFINSFFEYIPRVSTSDMISTFRKLKKHYKKIVYFSDEPIYSQLSGGNEGNYFRAFGEYVDILAASCLFDVDTFDGDAVYYTNFLDYCMKNPIHPLSADSSEEQKNFLRKSNIVYCGACPKGRGNFGNWSGEKFDSLQYFVDQKQNKQKLIRLSSQQKCWEKESRLPGFYYYPTQKADLITLGSLNYRELSDVLTRYDYQLQARCGYYFHNLRSLQSWKLGIVPIIFVFEKHLDEFFLYEKRYLLKDMHNYLLCTETNVDKILEITQDKNMTRYFKDNIAKMDFKGTIYDDSLFVKTLKDKVRA